MFALLAGGTGQTKAFLSGHCTLIFIFKIKFYVILKTLLPRSRCVCKNCEAVKRQQKICQLGNAVPSFDGFLIKSETCLPEDHQEGYCDSRKVWECCEGNEDIRGSLLSLSEEHELS